MRVRRSRHHHGREVACGRPCRTLIDQQGRAATTVDQTVIEQTVIGAAAEVVMRVVFVHGACVRDGSWWWHRTAELLQERGVPSAAPALPSCGETGEPAGAGGPG